MKKIMMSLLLIVLNGCATYNPEILYPVTNLKNFYTQCKNSEDMGPNSQGDLSYSDRYYCLGYVQAMSETTIYWRKSIGDINPNCQLTVKDFYHGFIQNIENGKFNDEKSVANAFRRLSYGFCPKVQNNMQYKNKVPHMDEVQYIDIDSI